jgi:hypothetical protein
MYAIVFSHGNDIGLGYCLQNLRRGRRSFMKSYLFGLVTAGVFALPAGAHAQAPPALLLFGWSDHRTFLGCLNCSDQNRTSVCNQSGPVGSSYGPDSIWNRNGNFGSPYSEASPWNPFATYPPAIVDKAGQFYGHLTANHYYPRRTTTADFNELTDFFLKTDDLDKVRDWYCSK